MVLCADAVGLCRQRRHVDSIIVWSRLILVNGSLWLYSDIDKKIEDVRRYSAGRTE